MRYDYGGKGRDWDTSGAFRKLVPVGLPQVNEMSRLSPIQLGVPRLEDLTAA